MPIIEQMHFPWLECSILLPLLGSIACLFIQDKASAQRIATVVSLLTFVFTANEWYDFSSLNTFEARDNWDAVQWLFGESIFVIDELSAPLLPLTALLYLLTIYSTLSTKLGRFSFGTTLFAESIVLATLGCHHLWTIVVLMSVACIPVWMELRRRHASTRIYTIHMGLFISMLVGGLALVDQGAGPMSASWLPTAMLTFAAVLRAGVFPLHLWMTDLFEHATLGTALLFVTPMTGAYAVIHLVVPFVPAWAMQSIALLSLVTAVYASGMATVQVDARRFFCYLFLSHASLVLVGLEIVTTLGLTGALCVWISVGISLGGFGLTLRSIEARIGRVSLNRFQGMYEHSPTLAGLFLLTGLASIGFPGTVGFVGMELLVEGAVGVFPLTGLAVVLVTMLNGIAIMRAYFRIFTGRKFETSAALRSRRSERLAVLVLTFLVIGGGLWPQPGVASRLHAAKALMKIRQRTQKEMETLNEDSRDALPFDKDRSSEAEVDATGLNPARTVKTASMSK